MSTGRERLQAHFPALRTPSGRAAVLAAGIAVFCATTGFFLLVDAGFAEWMPDGEIVVLALSFLILSRFFSQKDRYLAGFGSQAYWRAYVAFALPGSGILFGAVAHLAYMPGPLIPDVWWKPHLIGIGWLTLIVGALLWWRAFNALGLDNLLLLYVYFPADRRILNTGIYQILRHPIYGAALYLSAGLALIHSSWYSLLVALILPLFFFGWIRLVEERELLLHYPDYAEYRAQVPAFAPKMRDLGRFWHLLILGEEKRVS